MEYSEKAEQKEEFESTRTEIIKPKLDFPDKDINRVDHNTSVDKTKLQPNPFKPIWDELHVDSNIQSDFTHSQSREGSNLFSLYSIKQYTTFQI